ncbi:a3484499-6472-42e3-b067-604ff16e7b2f [Sclerotinia trifoliorum]|uniref:A3484499-6472-42e3-b067-604ff16e7b2f n=1 Tax=Sclerotinia trifoliorum TaxID=28548 RepID=A0A8H2W486_9HELO|nr:a3484499-6472-42e3-b067-604ff16e7b2f [Sclerotinia trifoliorum]
MLAYSPESRRQTSLLQHHSHQPSYNPDGSLSSSSTSQQLQQSQTSSQPQSWIPSSLPLTSQSTFPTNGLSNNINFNFDADQILFDFQPQRYSSSQQVPSRTFMQPIQSNSSWMSNGQLTPTSTSRRHRHRESSLSSLGSPAAPASPYAPSTSNPQVVGDSYHEFQDYHPTAPKPLTPAHTPLQENFLSPQYTNFYQNQNNLGFTMLNNDSLPRLAGGSNELISAPEFHSQGSSRPSVTTAASNESPSTPPSFEDERQPSAHRTSSHQMPKLDRTMTDAYNDELFNPSYPVISAPSPAPASTRTSATPNNDVFTQRLKAANHQHLNANKHEASNLSPRERSPFQPNSPLAPSAASFNTHNMGFATATRMREQQKAKDDALAMQEQYQRTNPEQVTPKTISPKDVDLVYQESDEDANNPLFPPPQHKQSPVTYRQQSTIVQEPSEPEDMSLSQQSYGSMATTRRESSSTYSTSSQTTPKQGQFNFATPTSPASVRQLPQHYPFIPSSHRQTSSMSNMSNVSNDFPATLTSMESSSDDYSAEPEIRRPSNTSADSGTYTCTYHGCTLRFETPAKLQKHKREGHRNSTSVINMGGENRGGMTSLAQKLNSQSGPHRCERINPSTGKPCNTVFSRPYDLTRHEDTIHNSSKQKLRCKYCTEEKTFSRNDALTRHLRVVHPEVPVSTGKGRRRGMGLGNMD